MSCSADGHINVHLTLPAAVVQKLRLLAVASGKVDAHTGDPDIGAVVSFLVGAKVPSSLVFLPVEIMIYCFEYLSGTDIVNTLPSVCRNWRAMIRSESAPLSLKALLQHRGMYIFTDLRALALRPKAAFCMAKDVPSCTAGLQKCVNDDTECLEERSMSVLLNDVSLSCRTHSVTLVYNRAVYRFGGRAPFFDPSVRLRSCYCFDPFRQSHRRVSPMKRVRSAACGAIIGSRAYVFGGFDGHCELNTFEVFDFGSMEWVVNTAKAELTTEFDMPFAICEAVAVAFNEECIILMGGCQHRGLPTEVAVPNVFAYCPMTDEWLALPDMSQGRILGSCVVLDLPDMDAQVAQVPRPLLPHLVYIGGQQLSNLPTQRTMPCNTALVKPLHADSLLRGNWVNVPFLEAGYGDMNCVSTRSTVNGELLVITKLVREARTVCFVGKIPTAASFAENVQRSSPLTLQKLMQWKSVPLPARMSEENELAAAAVLID